MRKTVFIFAIILYFIFSTPTVKVFATYSTPSEYGRITTHETPFYADEYGNEFLFYLPYSYYVKIIDTNDRYAHVEYQGSISSPILDGYVPLDMLFFDGLTVISPYPNLTVTTAYSCVLYQDLSLENSAQYLFKDRKLGYYGQAISKDGVALFCVYYNNKIGYIKETEVYPFVIENHPNELTFLVPETPNEQENPSSLPTTKEYDGIKYAVIICLLLAGVIALLTVLNRKGQTLKPQIYYDENDYE